MKKLVILMPAFNEEAIIGKVLDDLIDRKPPNFETEIVVINDGSYDQTESEAQKRNVTVLTHPLNRGLGGALGTGFLYAKISGADFVVTFDADGQHNPDDIVKILHPLVEVKADVVVGSRLLGKSTMPIDRKIINFLANILNFFLWGIWVTDTQSGLRAFTKKAVNKIKIKMNKMEVSSEILKEVKRNKLSLTEIPIKAIYTQYSRNKGQQNINAVNVFLRLLLHKIVDIK